MGFSRGYSFGTNEQVTASKLHRLVENATPQLTVDNLSGTVHGLRTSAPASPANGQVWHIREVPLYTASSYTQTSEIRYLVQTTFGEVALWDPYGLEIRRPVKVDPDPWALGDPVLWDGMSNPDNSGYTLAAYGANSTLSVHIGFLGSARASVVPGETGRIIFSGFAPCRFIASNLIYSPAETWPEFMWGRGNGVAIGPMWVSSGASAVDGLFGIRLTDLAQTNQLLPCFLFGAPIWHG